MIIVVALPAAEVGISITRSIVTESESNMFRDVLTS